MKKLKEYLKNSSHIFLVDSEAEDIQFRQLLYKLDLRWSDGTTYRNVYNDTNEFPIWYHVSRGIWDHKCNLENYCSTKEHIKIIHALKILLANQVKYLI